MKIQKYIKDKKNKYKVVIDDVEYTLYDDVIIKFELLRKSEIDKKTFDAIVEFNDELLSYYASIQYINRRLRTEKEIRDYLKRKGAEDDIIDKTIVRLKRDNYLDEEVFIRAYINDQIKILYNNGPLLIKKNLLKLGVTESKIDAAIDAIPEEVWLDKIEKYVERKIKFNLERSKNILKLKMTTDLISHGYYREHIDQIINEAEIDDQKAFICEYNRAVRRYKNTYSGQELRRKVKDYLYRKGFRFNNIEELEDEE